MLGLQFYQLLLDDLHINNRLLEDSFKLLTILIRVQLICRDAVLVVNREQSISLIAS